MTTEEHRPTATAAWYAAPIADFLGATDHQVLGELLQASRFDVAQDQRDAWLVEVALLRRVLAGWQGWVVLEFDIPRLGSRIDVVLIIGPALIPIECKVGAETYTRNDIDQAWDYGLDLKNFHAASHESPIFPILLATEAPDADSRWEQPHSDGVHKPRRCNSGSLRGAISEAMDLATGRQVDGRAWVSAAYNPTPTIIEAARALYDRHTVEAISRNDAGAKNLTTTSQTVEAIIETAARDRFKAILFVTGVPGAGKTLVGLNVATRRGNAGDATHTVFLSGNGPLVAVLREALTRDEVALECPLI